MILREEGRCVGDVYMHTIFITIILSFSIGDGDFPCMPRYVYHEAIGKNRETSGEEAMGAGVVEISQNTSKNRLKSFYFAFSLLSHVHGNIRKFYFI
jgi:hypothetical protein